MEIAVHVVGVCRFCKEVRAGEGRVLSCLVKHKFESTMSTEVLESCTEVLE